MTGRGRCVGQNGALNWLWLAWGPRAIGPWEGVTGWAAGAPGAAHVGTCRLTCRGGGWCTDVAGAHPAALVSLVAVAVLLAQRQGRPLVSDFKCWAQPWFLWNTGQARGSEALPSHRAAPAKSQRLHAGMGRQAGGFLGKWARPGLKGGPEPVPWPAASAPSLASPCPLLSEVAPSLPCDPIWLGPWHIQSSPPDPALPQALSSAARPLCASAHVPCVQPALLSHLSSLFAPSWPSVPSSLGPCPLPPGPQCSVPHVPIPRPLGLSSLRE